MQVNGQHLRRLREDKGLTARDLANAASISTPFLSQIEHGRRNPSPPVAARIAKALDVAIRDLRGEAA